MRKWFFSLITGAMCLGYGLAFAGNPFVGQSIYNSHCAGCHGGDGRGAIVGAPSFRAGSQALMNPDFKLRDVIARGKGIMPGFENVLKEDQIYDVIAHIRTFY